MKLEKKEARLALGHWSWLEVGQGPPVVLIPGFGDSKKTFIRLGRGLASKYKVYLVDTPGFGDSPAMEPQQYRLKMQVQRLAELFTYLALAKPILGGNSAGGHIACLFAMTHPTQCRALVLMAPQGLKTKEFRPYSQKLEAPQNIEQYLVELKKLYYQVPSLSEAKLLELLKRTQERWDWLNAIRKEIGSEEEHCLNHLGNKLQTPSLVIWGDEDGRIPPTMGPIWDSFNEGTTLCTLAECGHLPQLEKTQEVVEIIFDFLSKEARRA